jgi:hypothetical protein
MARFGRVLLLAALVLGVAAPAASAVPSKKLSSELGAMWTKVFETPSPENPFGSGGPSSGCLNLGGTVAPFGPNGVASCTVKPGTKVFVAASSFECSTFEGNGTTETELRQCARANDVQVAPAVTVDGRSQPVSEVETDLLRLVLREDNIFGLPPGSRGSSVAHGWALLLHPLTPGTHTIGITFTSSTITTTIAVIPGVKH